MAKFRMDAAAWLSFDVDAKDAADAVKVASERLGALIDGADVDAGEAFPYLRVYPKTRAEIRNGIKDEYPTGVAVSMTLDDDEGVTA